MDITDKQATQSTQDEQNTKQYVLDNTMRKQSQIT